MDSVELQALSAEIRRFLISSVAETGGHLGSNLGIVEVTIALHRVFSSPDDAIVWDTGHQAYVHKLVTGRQEEFAGLRQRGGLSGYPNRSESAHDLVENSHASTALSYAYGLAVSRRLRRDPRRVVAVVGDGALTGGVAYEALNNIGTSGANVVVVLNDNGRSYAPTVSRLSSAPPGPPASPASGAPGDLDDPAAAGDSPASDFFEALGLGYLGPVDGHDLDALQAALHQAAALGGPGGAPRPHGQGPRLRAGRTRRGEVPPRHRAVRHRHRRRARGEGGPPELHRGVRFGARARGRRSSRDRRDHGRHAGTDGTDRVPRAVPGPLLRRRHRGAARRQRRRRHGDGRSPAGGGDLLDVPEPGLGPDLLRRRPAPASGDLLPRPCRHHRRRRPEPPRRARPDAAHEGSGDDGLRPVLVRGGRQHAAGGAGHHLGSRWPSGGRRRTPAPRRP